MEWHKIVLRYRRNTLFLAVNVPECLNFEFRFVLSPMEDLLDLTFRPFCIETTMYTYRPTDSSSHTFLRMWVIKNIRKKILVQTVNECLSWKWEKNSMQREVHTPAHTHTQPIYRENEKASNRQWNSSTRHRHVLVLERKGDWRTSVTNTICYCSSRRIVNEVAHRDQSDVTQSTAKECIKCE